MKRDTPGITAITEHGADGRRSYRFGFELGRESEALVSLLGQMSDGDEISVADPDVDGSLEIRRVTDAFESKNGRHGSFGTWRSTSPAEALQWLLPGAQYASRRLKPGYGGEFVVAAKR